MAKIKKTKKRRSGIITPTPINKRRVNVGAHTRGWPRRKGRGGGGEMRAQVMPYNRRGRGIGSFLKKIGPKVLPAVGRFAKGALREGTKSGKWKDALKGGLNDLIGSGGPKGRYVKDHYGVQHWVPPRQRYRIKHVKGKGLISFIGKTLGKIFGKGGPRPGPRYIPMSHYQTY